MNNAQYRWLELFCIFILLPVAGLLMREYLHNWLIPALITLTAVCCFILLTDPHFKRFRITSMGQFSAVRKRIATFFLTGALFSGVLYGILNQENWFSYPLQSPLSWLMLLILYPLLSVLPQELIFRTYFFHRYKPIIPSKTWRIWLSASVFSLAHMVYGNWVAIVLSFCGGLLFSYTYAHSRSTLVCVLEHSLWGLWMFTLGLGSYLDSGAI
ncbi:CPBP family intramembrane metalloprotease [Pseudoalteromonas sp. CO325X]|uniref:CPBP family intramembrane glutamic endopeptidase n=1 Tax=Pseudoalteromonas sp. CO325X TaxID=1777262 RepID=UPI001022D3BE|nr:CPBP family intramembrane glutamic endopeptidase [Pseudoalteromonas sp. CO325X]RZF80113.1 CPBP family intramembrane metalloprotease [Pseudoalteromonas sp. CO325X]